MLACEPHPAILIAIYRLAIQQESCGQCGQCGQFGQCGCNVDLALWRYIAEWEYVKLPYLQQNVGVLYLDNYCPGNKETNEHTHTHTHTHTHMSKVHEKIKINYIEVSFNSFTECSNSIHFKIHLYC